MLRSWLKMFVRSWPYVRMLDTSKIAFLYVISEIKLKRVRLHESFVEVTVGFCARTQFSTTLSSGGRSDFAQGRNFRPPYQVGVGRILRDRAIFDHPFKWGQVGFCVIAQYSTTLSSGGRSDFAWSRKIRPPYQVGAVIMYVRVVPVWFCPGWYRWRYY